ncbi:mannitol dehydrogenase family protein [Tropicibacter sp. S64]|uniref:mannitol dehydrogenase family protein n=1 Tax=Tropicibacter sp. S64 TaxID=3415122 RepID=UPI003C7B225C
MFTTPIIQFGTSRFLQAHVDLFVSEALKTDAALGRIAVVQSTGDAARAKRLAALANGYDVRLRGIANGTTTDETIRVRSVAKTFSLNKDRRAVERIIAEEARIILSNTGDAGFAPQSADASPRFDDAMSYPAKLAHLLRAKYEAGGTPIQIMPTELVQDNGATLKRLVLNAAPREDTGYRDWLDGGVVWVNSLVDRIVSQPLDPAGAVAEPYALWAIEECPGLVSPCVHPDVRIVPDLGPVARRKLFILNLGHTWIVSRWLARGKSGAVFVRDVMADPTWSTDLRRLYETEVLPAFVAAGEGDGITDYMNTTLDRFANPFLDHNLSDIAQNHVEKLRRRVAAFVDWAQANGDATPKPMLNQALQGSAA